MGFFQKDLGFYDPFEDIVNKALELKVTGVDVEIEDEGGFVELVIEPVKPAEKK